MVGWCLDLDGRRDRDECAKPTVGRAGNLSDGIVAVFSLVRFQEKEMMIKKNTSTQRMSAVRE